jgi:uncharacterized membrane protein YhaH (DUF805 family)
VLSESKFAVISCLKLKASKYLYPSMSFTESISTCFAKYATFSGRATRSEYWWFYLFTTLLTWAAMIVDSVTSGGSSAYILVSLALAIPALSSAVRRLHDSKRSGWWLLLVFTIIGVIPVIIWLASEGKSENNQY